MRMRHKMSRKGSKKLFRKTASKTHRRNISPPPMRGGIRI